MAKIHWSYGGDSGSVELAEALTFGRGDENGLVLKDPKLSKVHARFEPDGAGGWRVVDQGSSNGLLAGGKRLPEIPLKGGGEFQAGDTTFRFEGATVSAVEKTVLQATVLAATPAPAAVPPPVAPPPAESPAATAVSPAESAAATRSKKLKLALIFGIILVSFWIMHSRSRGKVETPGQKTAGTFASEEEKKVVALENDLASSSHATRWGAYEKLKAMGKGPDPKPLWILDLKYEPDDDDREKAAEKLGEARYTPAIPQLRASQKNDTDWNVRRAAKKALEKMGIAVD